MRNGDPLARPEQLFRRVYAYVAYRLGHGPDAEDVTSEVFERALRYRASYNNNSSDPVSWLVGIARNCIADSAAARRETVGQFPDAADDGDLEERTLRRLRVRAAVAELSERDRELVALRYGADLTASQIGHVLGLTTNTVEVALHRSLRRLRAAFDEPRSSGPAPTELAEV
jgi:RNA polymerase sigma-70 factor (ECF subfamily)